MNQNSLPYYSFESIFNLKPNFILENYNINFQNYYENILILNCYFFQLNSNSNGGAINIISNLIIKLMILTCSFNKCTSISYGGAIYLNSQINGSFLITKTCGYFCYNNGGHGISGQFCEIISNDLKYNIFDLNSITKCSPNIDSILRWTSIRINNGIQIINNINSSFNYLNAQSGFWYQNSNSLISKFNTFFSNYAGHQTIAFTSGNNLRKLEYTNIIKCNSPDQQGVIILYNNPIIYIENCIFLDNNPSYRLFYIDSGFLYLNNCFIKHITTFNFGSYTKFNCIISNLLTKTYSLIHFNTYLCPARLLINSKKYYLFKNYLIFFYIIFN